MIKKLRIKNKKLSYSFNKLNQRRNYNTITSLNFRKNNLLLSQNDSIKNNFNTIEKPFISQTYYKDPFFLNEINLKTQLQILRAIDREKLNNNIFIANTDSNKETLPTLYDFKSKTNNNYFNNDELKSEDFFYKSVFKMKPLFRRSRPIVDNKLNMKYAENEEQYKNIVEKEQKILLAMGKKVKNKNSSEHIKIKMDEIKKRIRFMKGIIDFTFPGFVLTKIRSVDKELKKENDIKNKLNEYFSPVELRNMNKTARNNERKNYLFECINIKNKLNK